MPELIETWAGQVPIHGMPLRNTEPRPISGKSGISFEQVYAFVAEHPWCDATEVAKHFGVFSSVITCALSRGVLRGRLQRRGKCGAYQYRLAK